MLLNGAAKIEETATQLAGRLRNQATKHASLLTIELPRGLLAISCSVTRFSDSFVCSDGTKD
jgi:hypothetical protein